VSWGFIGDLADAACDVVSDVGSGIADAAVAVGEAAVDVAGNAGGYLGDGIGFAGGFVDTATFGGASAILNAVDDTVLDGVDYVTDGVVDIDFDDGRFSASVGIDGVASAGASIGEDGVTASADSFIASTDVGLTDDGFAFDSSGGIDFGPLPYYNGHVDVSPTGDVSINGHIQGTVPTPYGLLSGEASGGFVRTDQGWGTYVDADGSLLLPSGTTIAAGVNAGYMETADGDSQTTFGAHGSVSEPGVGTVGGSFGYQSTTHDGVTLTTQSAEAHASGFGATASASEQYIGLETPEGSISQTTTDFDLSGPSVDQITNLGNSLLGDDLVAGTGTTASAMTAAEAGAGGDATPGTTSFDDDVLGASSVAGAPGSQTFGNDLAFSGSDPAGSDPSGAGASTEPSFEGGGADPAAGSMDAAAAPVDDFDTQISSADQIDTSADTMFDDLG
jgi:hypothetical protein